LGQPVFQNAGNSSIARARCRPLCESAFSKRPRLTLQLQSGGIRNSFLLPSRLFVTSWTFLAAVFRAVFPPGECQGNGRVVKSKIHKNGGNIVQDLIHSFVRLSAAMTVYSMQQMQSAVETIDPKDSITRLKHMIDSMADALTMQIDESKKATVDKMSNLGSDVVEKTFETLSGANLKPREIVQTTTDIVRKTTSSLAEMIKPSDEKKEAAGTPKTAEEVLAAH
jgi:hypothetical protein